MENREIKYRGINCFNNQWVYGSLIVWPDSDCEIVSFTGKTEADKIAVKRDSIGRLTHLVEKNGLEIYIGDIVKFHYFYMGGGAGGATECEAELTGLVDEDEYGLVVKAIKGEHWAGYTGYADTEGSSYIMGLCSMNESIHESSFEKIGDTHTTPHLLTTTQDKK